MRTAFFIIGILAGMFGTSLVIATIFSIFAPSNPSTAYGDGGVAIVAGALLLLAGARNYHGHWSFVIGVALSTVALFGFISGGYTPGKLFLCAVMFSFGLLSIWSGHKLHCYTLELERIACSPQPGFAVVGSRWPLRGLWGRVINYHGHWSFVFGVALSLFGLYGLGNESSGLGLLMSAITFSFGLLSLWSGHKLHRCTLELERIATRLSAGFGPVTIVGGGDRAICAECTGVFSVKDMISYDGQHLCARCKPVFLQKLGEGAKIGH